MSNFVIPEIKAAEEEMIAIRHYLHAHPELSLEEFNTSELVAEKLAEWGYAVTRDLGKTGLVGSLTKGHSARTIGLRADMDALPILKPRNYPGPAPLRENARLRPRRSHHYSAGGGKIYCLAGLPV